MMKSERDEIFRWAKIFRNTSDVITECSYIFRRRASRIAKETIFYWNNAQHTHKRGNAQLIIFRKFFRKIFRPPRLRLSAGFPGFQFREKLVVVKWSLKFTAVWLPRWLSSVIKPRKFVLHVDARFIRHFNCCFQLMRVAAAELTLRVCVCARKVKICEFKRISF